jgi:predicted nucleic acid-binding protein
MSVARYWVDTTILLRFLTGHPTAQAESAHRLLQKAGAGEVVLDVSPVIVAEAFYTLTSFYKVDRAGAAIQLGLLLRQHGIRVRDGSVVFGALQRLQSTNVGFADALLAAAAEEDGIAVASFDKDFDRLGIRRHDPGCDC